MAQATTQRQIAILLQQALSHLSRSQFVSAEELLQRALLLQSDHADALHLFGQMRWVQKRHAEAEALYRRTLDMDPRRAEAHCHLGQVLHAMNRLDEAITALSEALRLKPDLVEASRILTAAHITQAHHEEAEAVARAALAKPQRDPRQIAALKHNLGIALSQQHRLGEALVEFDAAQTLMPGLPRADYNRGNTLQLMGRLDEAEEAYRRAVARDPLDLKAHGDLNHLLYRLGRTDILRSYDEAACKHPRNAALLAEKATFLFRCNRYEEAREMFSRALVLSPENAGARDGLGMTLTRLGCFGEATQEYERLLAANPANAEAGCNFAECLLRAGDAEKSVAVSEQTLARAPHHQYALALWGTGLRQLRDAREEALNDYENFVQVYDLVSPEGFADMKSFNGVLDAYLGQLHVYRREHLNQTSRFGTQTQGMLFGAHHKLVERLRVRIDDAVADYIARMTKNKKHPLLGRRAHGFRYSGSWSTRLADCGFHTNHVHPVGWISSAYYVALPDVVTSETGQRGWLKFGEPSFDTNFCEPVRRTVQPRPGRLVLFPSYMWHGTVPFRSQEARTTIAFDAVPTAQPEESVRNTGIRHSRVIPQRV